MQDMIVLAMMFVGLVLVVIMVKQGLSRSCDLLSVRNLFLTGFIIYQIVSPALALFTRDYTFFKVHSALQSGKTLLAFMIVFLAVFFFSYHRLRFTPWFARKLTGQPREMSDTFLLALAAALVAVAAPMRVLGPMIPAIGAASAQVAIALAAVATAVAGWVWGNRRTNPLVLSVVVGVVVGCLAITMIGSFSRRPMLSVLMGFAWGAYHRRFKFMRPGRLVFNTVPLLLVVLAFIGAFTASRGNRRTPQSSVAEVADSMAGADVRAGVSDIFRGQATGSATLWVMENYPDRFEQRPFFSLRFMAMWYVPRAIWPEKPAPLGNDIARLARIPRMNWNMITIPPGMLGYAEAEGGILTLIVYALFYGQFLRFFDELIRLNPNNAAILLPIGCITGQMLGLARGCIAIFANLMVLGFVSSYLILVISNKFFGRRIPQPVWFPQQQFR